MNENRQPEHVQADDPTAAAYWARYFQVPVENIRGAVATVGDAPEKVAEYLGKPYPNPQSGIV